jgi:SAM-dependent methyltransferase
LPVSGSPAPDEVASWGCGDPLAKADLREGEVVLDLGSGGGRDVFRAARQVGPSGLAYGLDMTEEMLALAEGNAHRLQVTNARFLKGILESIPLPDASVDVIISNCVINLTADKGAVLAEAWRVLHPGGRLAISDIVIDPDLEGLAIPPDRLRSDLSWSGCWGGALTSAEYRTALAQAGFAAIELDVESRSMAEALSWQDPAVPASLSDSEVQAVAGRFASMRIRAQKPAASRNSAGSDIARSS